VPRWLRRQSNSAPIAGLLSRPHKYRLVHLRLSKIPDSAISVVIRQAWSGSGCGFVGLDGPSPPCNRFAQFRIGEDEVDNLVLCAESGGAIFARQFAVKLDRIGEGIADQLDVFGSGSHQLRFHAQIRWFGVTDRASQRGSLTGRRRTACST